jgi:hypothetical protein
MISRVVTAVLIGKLLRARVTAVCTAKCTKNKSEREDTIKSEKVILDKRSEDKENIK